MNQRRFQVFTRPPKGTEVQKPLVTFSAVLPWPPQAPDMHTQAGKSSRLSLDISPKEAFVVLTTDVMPYGGHTHTQATSFALMGLGNREGRGIIFLGPFLSSQSLQERAGRREQAAGFNSRCQPHPTAADRREGQWRCWWVLGGYL